jgi:hypothetical protein
MYVGNRVSPEDGGDVLARNSGMLRSLQFTVALVPLASLLVLQDESANRLKDTGAAVIWRDPGNVEQLDLGSPEGAPQPPFVFSEEDSGGRSAKIIVTDAGRRKWSVKWGEEVKAETFVTRLVSATGYFVEPSYFVPKGRVESVGKLGRAAAFIDRKDGGAFKNARFELRDGTVQRLTRDWSLVDNPFTGSKELHGLKVMMMLVSNWDVKDTRSSDGPNTSILRVQNRDGSTELRYIINDWGASMGKWGNVMTRSKWDCKGYESQTPEFVKGKLLNDVGFGFEGKRTEDMVRGITTEDVRWLIQYLGRISDDQLLGALKASGATAEEEACFTSAVRARIEQLRTVSQ